MPAPSDDAFVTGSADPIAALASLYDRFAYALDPFSKERDEAERVFMEDVANWYDSLEEPKPSLHEFRKGVIQRCKSHLKSADKHSSLPP